MRSFLDEVVDMIKDIIAAYDKSPYGWFVLADGKGSIPIIGPESAFRLRLVMLNPQEYEGVGARVTA